MKVKVVWGTKNKKATYRVKAKDLEAVRKILEKKSEAGSFDWGVPMSYKYDMNKNVTEITIKPRYKLTMPVWRNYPSQPKECKYRWDKMWKKLKEHEEGHLKLFEAGIRHMKNALESLGPTTKPEDTKALHAEEVAKIQSESNKYDKKTDHGRKTGVVLVVPAQCGG